MCQRAYFRSMACTISAQTTTKLCYRELSSKYYCLYVLRQRASEPCSVDHVIPYENIAVVAFVILAVFVASSWLM